MDELPLPPFPWRFPGVERDWRLPRPGGGSAETGPAPRAPGGTPARPRLPSGTHPPQESAAAKAEALKKALRPKQAPEEVRKDQLDALFQRLHEARDPEDAQRIAQSIERLWLQSQSDTANLLMQRAITSVQANNYELALSLLDKLVALEPDWAEAWHQRATARFLSGDPNGAMADINKVIRLEPRHFGALEGMGMILRGEGLSERALEIFKKALAIYPLAPDLQSLVEKLTHEVEGEDI